MNEYIQENKRSLLLLLMVLLIFAVVLYFLLLRPLTKDVSSKQEAIVSIEEEIKLLEQKLATADEVEEEVDIDQLLLENKIPSERELDDYILSLQRLEVMTKSRIDSIEFVYDSSLEVEESEVQEEASREDDDVDEEGSPDDEESEAAEEAVQHSEIIQEKPEALHVMTVKLTAHSPNFKEFIELLKVIENEKRISIVTGLHFLKPTERDEFDDFPLDSIPFEADLTTFYYAE